MTFNSLASASNRHWNYGIGSSHSTHGTGLLGDRFDMRNVSPSSEAALEHGWKLWVDAMARDRFYVSGYAQDQDLGEAQLCSAHSDDSAITQSRYASLPGFENVLKLPPIRSPRMPTFGW